MAMTLTPEIIKGKLFSFADAAHSLHLDTRSFAEHKALEHLYTELVGFKDELCELLMGYQNGKRIGKAKLEELPTYSQEAVTQMVKDGLEFSSSLEQWAEDKEYCDIENTAQSLSGLFARTQYLLTLS
jgi:hypothetical protein